MRQHPASRQDKIEGCSTCDAQAGDDDDSGTLDRRQWAPDLPVAVLRREQGRRVRGSGDDGVAVRGVRREGSAQGGLCGAVFVSGTRSVAITAATLLTIASGVDAQDTTQAYPWRLSYFPYVTASP